jgi:arylsulfatase A-like enzyme
MLQRYSTDQYTDWAVDFIEGKDVSGKARDKQKPWYLWLCYGAVHGPHTPADRHMKEYAGVDVETPADIFPPRAGKPDWAQKIQMWDKGPGGAPMFRNRSLSSWVQQYHQGVNALDEGFKRVLEALEKSGQKKNTLIIFTADQGLAFGQHGFRSVKVAPYDSNIRAPFVMAMTGRIKEGGVVDVPIGGIDIVPTIFKFAGIQQPWAMDGRDLTPLLENPKANWPHPAMIVGTGQKFGSDTHVLPTGAAAVHSQVPWYVMLRHGKHKYVRPLVTDLEELYDLQADPDELNNLAVKPEHQELLKQFRARAIEELRRNKAGFVDRMPEVKMAVR